MVKRKKTSLISVQGTPVTIIDLDQNDYISLTDMAKARTDSARAADMIRPGHGPALPWSFWGLGKVCTIRISKWSNSTT